MQRPGFWDDPARANEVVARAKALKTALEPFAAFAGELDDAGREALVLDRHALHSSSLTFFHPRKGRDVTIEAPLPQELADLMA